jgi:hypothetical protein
VTPAAKQSVGRRSLALKLTRLVFRPYRQRKPPSKMVAIVVPLSNRPGFTPDEQISLRHLQHFLGHYDKFLIAPRGMPLDVEGCHVVRFSGKYFGSAAAHGRLLYSPFFYRRFADYRYIFFYHLDSLAFSDQLMEWCATGVDYIGPPWLKCDDSPWVQRSRVGNGGFTLLKVESALKVLRERYREKTSTYWIDLFMRIAAGMPWVIALFRTLQPRFPRFKPISVPLSEWDKMQDPAPHRRNNDIFWSDDAVRYVPSFRVASLEEGLRFAFEVAPSMCLEMNGGKMPFGCHAWARYDRKFWEPHLLKPASPRPSAIPQ